MPFPGGTYLTEIASLGAKVASEFDQFYGLLEGWLRVEHDEDGHHTNITAESITVDGDVEASNGTFDGDVTADADGEPIVLEANSVLGPGVAIRGTLSQWRIAASPSTDTLTIRDESEAGNTSTISIIKTAAGPATQYDIRPSSSSVSLRVGTNTANQRMAEVNTVTLTASTVATIATITATTITQTARLSLTTRNTHALTASVNNLAIQGPRVVLSSDGAYNITGIVAGVDGELLYLFNNSGFAITLTNNDGASAAGNKLAGANSANVVLRANNGSALLVYDATSAVWFILGA